MIVKVEFEKEDLLLQQLDKLAKETYRSRPMMVKFILSEYFKGLDIEEPIVAKETTVKEEEVVEPKVEVSVPEVDMEEDIPFDALNF